MIRPAILALAGVMLALTNSAHGQPVAMAHSRAPLAGVWRLVSYVDRPEGGAPVYAFGEQPVGQFLFTDDGHVSVNIMRNPPSPDAASTDIDPDACHPAWYCSYFGTYEVTPDGGTWITRVEGGNIPTYIGTSQSRTFKIAGERLTISETYREGGRMVRAERVLQRVGH